MITRYKWIVVLLALCLLATVAACDKMNLKIPGKVAGQCLTAAGAPAGFISVELVDTKTNVVVQAMNAEETGSFLFDKVDPGEYIIKTRQTGEIEIPNDNTPFKLSPGKTLTISVTVDYSKIQKPE